MYVHDPMETVQACSASQNIYEEAIRAESTYQTLHFKNPVESKQRTAGRFSLPRSKAIIICLLTFISVLLVIILVIVAVHYSHSTSSGKLSSKTGFSVAGEVWHLHDNVFYLLWHGQGTCQNAIEFCSRQNATLATLHEQNWDWMESLLGEEHLWVKANPNNVDGSGLDVLLFPKDEEDCSCELFSKDITSSAAAIDCEHTHGWVCERKMSQCPIPDVSMWPFDQV
ncbi:hypothetical protein MATL_G00054940 [Megalops atlanticus]|uniref:C-type lectin domain-containing protein n=1 Tax=Megalops atlanticus TaxID=7932 RepID=A0A9D3QB22_MEGAT|nr:hypothetical protein MATL_G00054940 [Megalops atlanticus]